MTKKIDTNADLNGFNDLCGDLVSCTMYDHRSEREAFDYGYEVMFSNENGYLECWFTTTAFTKEECLRGALNQGEVYWELNREAAKELMKNLRRAIQMMDKVHGKSNW